MQPWAATLLGNSREPKNKTRGFFKQRVQSRLAKLGGRTYKIRTCDQRIKRPQPPFKIKHLQNRYLFGYPNPVFWAIPQPFGTLFTLPLKPPCPIGQGSRFDTIAPPATLAPVERHGIGVPVARRRGKSRAIEVAAFFICAPQHVYGGLCGAPARVRRS